MKYKENLTAAGQKHTQNRLVGYLKNLVKQPRRISDIHKSCIQLQQLYTQLQAQSIQTQQEVSVLKEQLKCCKTVISSNDALCVQYDWNLLIGLPKGEWRLAMYLSLGGHFEYGSEVYFRNIVKPGHVVIDVGANVGIYTLHALRGGGEVYAFEPTPETFKVLQNNAALNGFEFSDKVHLNQVAVADKKGFVDFATVEFACGHNSMYPENATDTLIRVPCVTLDEMLEDVEKVDVVKIDVEGAEALVLRGMEKLVRRSQNITVMMEYSRTNFERAGVSVEDMTEILDELDLKMIRVIDEATGALSEPITLYDIADNATQNIVLQKSNRI